MVKKKTLNESSVVTSTACIKTDVIYARLTITQHSCDRKAVNDERSMHTTGERVRKRP